MVHIDRGGDWNGTQWFFDNLRAQQVEFDIIGESYYPWWHGSLDDLRCCLTNAASRYAKPVIVAETAFSWATNSWDGAPLPPVVGIKPGVSGQVEFVIALAKIVKSVPGGLGLGICWWGTEYQRLPGTALAGFDTRSFFEDGGNTLPVAGALGQLAAPLRLEATLAGTALMLQWPLSGVAMKLMTSANLTPATVWLPVTAAAESTGGGFSITLPASAGHNRFFRLQSD
ncbi:MAG: glycosyl hydrolase 53 family protein [Chloroflexi bacterium]|nr:glycosyl hydrolase 53 family protein [Chloroflexota bacterium]